MYCKERWILRKRTLILKNCRNFYQDIISFDISENEKYEIKKSCHSANHDKHCSHVIVTGNEHTAILKMHADFTLCCFFLTITHPAVNNLCFFRISINWSLLTKYRTAMCWQHKCYLVHICLSFSLSSFSTIDI